MPSNNDPLIGKKMGDYIIQQAIGQGGMARIYKGYDNNLQRHAAIKIFDAQGVSVDELDEYRQRFMREARAIARLRHPNIVNVYQTGQYEDLNYMAMMFIEGRDLRYILKDHSAHGSRLPKVDILRIMTDIASALDYAHREGVIHRDVKPSNVMITADGHAILTDFGLALSVPEGTIGTTFGSVHYIAPEQATSSAMAVPQSDLYSLGVVLYEMLTGKVPFDDASAMSVALKHLGEPPPPPTLFNPEITPEVEIMVLRSLDKEPGKRYQTGSAFIDALETSFGMTDEDEMTRRLMALPEWAQTKQDVNNNARASQPSRASAMAMNPPSQMIYATSDEKTISDVSGAARPPRTAPAKANNRNRNLLLIGLVIAGLGLIAIAAGLLLSNQSGGVSTSITQIFGSETPAAVAMGETVTVTSTTVPPTATVTSGTEATRDATEETSGVPLVGNNTTEEAAAESTTPAATATRVIQTVSATSAGVTATRITPTNSATRTVAVTVSATVAATEASSTAVVAVSNPDAQVELIYDDKTLILYNRSEDNVDVSNLLFAQTSADGREMTFQSTRWGGGSRDPNSLPSGDCFQVWTFNDGLLEQPEDCNVRHAWRQVGPTREFWLSDVAGASFEVRRGDEVLAECVISTGVCSFDVQDETDS